MHVSNQLSLVVQSVNEEGCFLKGDPWPCLLMDFLAQFKI